MRILLTRKQAQDLEPTLTAVLLEKAVQDLPKTKERLDRPLALGSLRFGYMHQNKDYHFNPDTTDVDIDEMTPKEFANYVFEQFFNEKVNYCLFIDTEIQSISKTESSVETVCIGYNGTKHSINKSNVKQIINEIVLSEPFSKMENNRVKLMQLNIMFSNSPTQMKALEYHIKYVSKDPGQHLMDQFPEDLKDEIKEYGLTGIMSENLVEFLSVISGCDFESNGEYTTKDGETKIIDAKEIPSFIYEHHKKVDPGKIIKHILGKLGDVKGSDAIEAVLKSLVEKIGGSVERIDLSSTDKDSKKDKKKEFTLDYLLDKIGENGVESLTPEEKEALDRLSQK